MSMMYGNGPWEMMGPYGGGIFMWIVLFVIMVIVIYLATRLARPTGVGETHLDILKKRYAQGEITKEEFEQKKKDLDL